MTTKAAALKRMRIVIQGVAQRTVSSVDELVDSMKASGASDEAVLNRINQEMEEGRLFQEIRQFASAKAPGFVGDMLFRFARDSLQADQNKQTALDRLNEEFAAADSAVKSGTSPITSRDIELLSLFEKKRTDKSIRDETGLGQEELLRETAAIREKLGLPAGASLRDAAKEYAENGIEAFGMSPSSAIEERARMEEIRDAYESQGIIISALEGDELPEPPPDAPLTALFRWVTVHDEKVCSVCAENHNVVQTLGVWSEIGEPRSGACLGDQNCRCILVPDEAITEADRQFFEKPIIKPRK